MGEWESEAVSKLASETGKIDLDREEGMTEERLKSWSTCL